MGGGRDRGARWGRSGCSRGAAGAAGAALAVDDARGRGRSVGLVRGPMRSVRWTRLSAAMAVAVRGACAKTGSSAQDRPRRSMFCRAHCPSPRRCPDTEAADLPRVPAKGLNRRAVERHRVGEGADQAHAPRGRPSSPGRRWSCRTATRSGGGAKPAQVGDGGVRASCSRQLEQLGVAGADHRVEHVFDRSAPHEVGVEDGVGQVDHHVGIQHGAYRAGIGQGAGCRSGRGARPPGQS